MVRIYFREGLDTVAKQTAEYVGCKAVCWWLDAGVPQRLHIKAEGKSLHGRPLTVELLAILPEGEPQPEK